MLAVPRAGSEQYKVAVIRMMISLQCLNLYYWSMRSNSREGFHQEAAARFSTVTASFLY